MAILLRHGHRCGWCRLGSGSRQQHVPGGLRPTRRSQRGVPIAGGANSASSADAGGA